MSLDAAFDAGNLTPNRTDSEEMSDRLGPVRPRMMHSHRKTGGADGCFHPNITYTELLRLLAAGKADKAGRA